MGEQVIETGPRTPPAGPEQAGHAIGAVIAYTSYLATEAAARNVLVNAISPGLTLTEGWLSRHEGMAKQQGKTADQVRDAMAGSTICARDSLGCSRRSCSSS